MSPDITENLLPLLREGEQILDVGCGDASLLKQLSGRGFRLYGTDPALAADRSPFQGLQDVTKDITLLAAAAEQLPFEDGLFDAVILQCVFSLCRPEEAAREVCRVLKPCGRLILSDLYTEKEETEKVLFSSPLVSSLWSKVHLEAFFAPLCQLLSFRDLTPALTEMIVSAIWDGEEDSCGSCADLSDLRRAGARYGLWVWEKQ